MDYKKSMPTNVPGTPRSASPGPLSSDFIRQQVSKQQKSNYHSSSLKTMSVNKTNLHPSGVAPSGNHTELEEELHEIAHIDYDRVAIIANPSVAALYEDALVYETGSAITSTGALTAYSGQKTGRSPMDKRVVQEPGSERDVWWGPVNKPMSPDVWKINRERAVDYLNTRNRIYVVDGFAGWDEKYRINVRVVCARAYHALFMRNMLIRPSREELVHFHPDYTIYNAGSFPANRYTTGMTSATSVAINFAEKEMVILGTDIEFCTGLFDVLQASSPPSIDWFLSLPSAGSPDLVWGVYIMILWKPGHRYILYVGSETLFVGCVRARFREYNRGELPRYVTEALRNGYTIKKKALLATRPITQAAKLPVYRVVLLALEAIFACYFWAMYKRDHDYGFNHLCLWPLDSFTYDGACSHSPLKEGFERELDLSEVELQQIADDIKAKNIEYGRKYHKNQRIDATSKFKAAQAKANKK
ncbi:MAG: Protein kinase C-like 1 [Stictis urceolatum]|nr:Protein kinase C-like 1 [Stictis urceolata]